MTTYPLTKEGLTLDELVARIMATRSKISPHAMSSMKTKAFELRKPGSCNIGLFTAKYLGVADLAETDLFGKAGVERLYQVHCEFAEIDDAPHFRYTYPNQPLGQRVWFAQRPIQVPPYQFIFTVECEDNGQTHLKVLHPDWRMAVDPDTLLAVRILEEVS